MSNKQKQLRYPLAAQFNQRQAGIALPLTLIMLLAMTLIAVATLRTTTLEENMTANTRLRQIAFNTAETTVREAETAIKETINDLNRRESGIRSLFFGTGNISPNLNAPGDLCEARSSVTGRGGFCTPAVQTFTPADTIPPYANASPEERWADTNLNVWENEDRHSIFTNLIGAQLQKEGVIDAPKYIIEFLGNYDYKEADPGALAVGEGEVARPEFAGAFTGTCRDETNNELKSPNDDWPYCASDSAIFRITVRATAGPRARRAEVLLQSQFRTVGG